MGTITLTTTSPALPPAVYGDYYDSGTTTVGTSATKLGLDVERQSDALFSLASDEVTIQAGGAGDYLVTYAVTFGDGDSLNRVTETWLELNGVEVDATRGEVGHWDEHGIVLDGTCGRTAILTLAASDVLNVQAQVTTGGAGYTTATGGVGLTISSIGGNGAAGPTGPQGPTGSGSNIIVEGGGAALANTPHSTLNFVGLSATDSGGGVAEIAFVSTAAYADYYNSAAYAGITTTASTLPLNTTRQSNAAFVLVGNEVRIDTAGTYRVDYDLSLDESSTSDTTVDMWLEVNGSEVGGTRARMFHDSNMEEGGNHGNAIITFAAADILRIRAQVVQGSSQTDTLANGTRLLISTIGATGATGAQGPAGSGSTIIVDDEGSTVSGGPFSTLDFVGAGVTATDAGGGTATVTIPGGSGSTANVAQYRRNSDESITTSATTITLNATDFEDSNFSASGGEITINADGVYRISYSIYFDTNTNARRTVDGWVEKDGTEIVPSRSSSYTRNNTDDTANSAATFLVELVANEIITLVAQSTGTSGTALGKGNRIWIMLEYVRAP